jgi:hypothetical protein
MLKLVLLVTIAILVASFLHRLSFHLPFGAINGRWLRMPPAIDDPAIGRSAGLPFVMRFRVDPEATGFPGGIGRVAHDALFAGRPGLTFNVVFACARPDARGRSAYADPRSIWHNVFFGCFQVDVAQEEWGRPFAYDLDDDGRSAVRLAELATLVKADWNHFSNQLYGVPASAIARLDTVDADRLGRKPALRVRKEGWEGAWDLAEFEDLEVVSPYSAKGGADYEDRDALVGRLWRRTFGTSDVAAGGESFPPAHMRMRAYMCWRPGVDARGVPVYQTFVFGAVVNKAHDAVDPAENARFLALQMVAVERLVAAERGLGFVDAGALEPLRA